MRSLVVIVACTVLAALSPVALASSRVSERAAATSQIVFSARGAGGQLDLWAAGANGRGLLNLTKSAKASERQPAWSPNRKKIAFVKTSKSQKSGQLFILDVKSGKARRLATGSGKAAQPAWSSNGRTIAFIRARGGQQDLVSVPAGGGKVKVVVPTTEDGPVPANPTWLRSSRIIFDSGSEGSLWIVNANGSNAHPYPQSKIPYSEPPTVGFTDPSAARNGSLVAVKSGKLWLLKANGTPVKRLTRGSSGSQLMPSWAPNSKSVVFVLGKKSIAIADAKTGKVKKIVASAAGAESPAWRP